MKTLILAIIACTGIVGMGSVVHAGTALPWTLDVNSPGGPDSWSTYERGRMVVAAEFKIGITHRPCRGEIDALVKRLESSDAHVVDDAVTAITSIAGYSDVQYALSEKIRAGGAGAGSASRILSDFHNAYSTTDRSEALATLQVAIARKDVRLVGLVLQRYDDPCVTRSIAALQSLGDKRGIPSWSSSSCFRPHGCIF